MVKVIWLCIFFAITCILYACSSPNIIKTENDSIPHNQPSYHIGDSWTYDNHYPIPCNTWEVTSLEAPENMVLKCDTNELHYSVNNSLNLVKAVNNNGELAYTADPYWPHLSFPLQIGKCWELSWKGTDPTLDWSWNGFTKACVTSREKIEVAAGTFDTLRIEYRDTFICCGGDINGYDKLTTWYSPEAKAIIKYDSKRYPFWNHELVSYTSAIANNTN